MCYRHLPERSRPLKPALSGVLCYKQTFAVLINSALQWSLTKSFSHLCIYNFISWHVCQHDWQEVVDQPVLLPPPLHCVEGRLDTALILPCYIGVQRQINFQATPAGDIILASYYVNECIFVSMLALESLLQFSDSCFRSCVWCFGWFIPPSSNVMSEQTASAIRCFTFLFALTFPEHCSH